MLTVDLNTQDIPRLFSRFRDVIGEKHWRHRASAVRAEMRGSRFLHEYLIEENDFVLAFDRCSSLIERYGQMPLSATGERALYPAIAFAAQVLSIVDISTPQQGKQLIRRIHGAFRNPDEFRAIRLELMAATHFVRRGLGIGWPEMEGTGTFDLMVTGLGVNGLQVECKSISNDKGRKIHRREALEFYRLVYRDLVRVTQNLESGLAVILTLPGRLPSALTQRKGLARLVVKAIMSGQAASLPEGGDIRISQFDMAAIAKVDPQGRLEISKSDIERVTATRDREGLILGSRRGGAIVFILQSANEDRPLDYVFDTLSNSAKTQVSNSLPALFLVGFDGVEPGELVNVATQDFDPEQQPTALRIAVSKFLSSKDRDHIIGVTFLSRSALTPKLHGEFDSGGSAYIFPRRESRFWLEEFSGLFSTQSK